MSMYNEKPKVGDVYQPPQPVGEKPKVWGIVILGFIRGIFGFIVLLNTKAELDALPSHVDVPAWLNGTIYLGLGLAVAAFIAAFMIMMFKRWGLYFGMVAFGGDLLLGVALILLYGMTSSPLAFILDGIVVYYIYKYMTNPAKSAYFT